MKSVTNSDSTSRFRCSDQGMTPYAYFRDRVESLEPLAAQQAALLLFARRDFFNWSGSARREHHHYGSGGLAQHTMEVARIAEATRALVVPQLDADLVFLAAVYHDIGKLLDYEQTEHGVWVHTPHKRLIHHITRSAMLWEDNARAAQYPEDSMQSVTHAILAHHGQREWGSPVEPQTKLAWLIHLSDNMSARLDDTLQVS